VYEHLYQYYLKPFEVFHMYMVVVYKIELTNYHREKNIKNLNNSIHLNFTQM
jgi:hypothetical protein